MGDILLGRRRGPLLIPQQRKVLMYESPPAASFAAPDP